MKVAFLSFDFGEYCVRLASALVREANVLLMLPIQLATAHQSKLDRAVKFHPFNKPRLRQPLKQIAMIHSILRLVRNFNPQVIHFQGGHLWFNLALPLLSRYPLVVTIHDPRQHVGDMVSRKTPGRILDFGYRRADEVIVHAKQLKQIVVEELHLPAEKVHTIPHIAIGENASYQHIQEEENLVMFFGRIWEYKGLQYLIQAEPLITAQIPDVRIIVAGQGEDFGRYRRMMVHPERFMVFNEYVSHDRRTELFRRASVVVLPYIEASQSGVIPLAYTFAKPVVATAVGGIPEMVEHGRTGYLVPPRNVEALADAIVRLLKDSSLRRRFGLNARQKIAAECSPEVIARKTLTVYRRAMAQ